MHSLRLPRPTDQPLRVLCLGAHADDIEIGCGGTLLTLLAAQPCVIRWIVLSANETRAKEARAAATVWTAEAEEAEIVIEHFTDGRFPEERGAIKDYFEAQKTFSPDLVFTHTLHDRHQDHRLLAELAWNTWRNHLVLEYEIPKYEGDLGQPTCFVPLAPATVERKLLLLHENFASQRGKHWFDAELFRGLMRLRGAESAAVEGYAEAFHGRKVCLEF